MANNGAILGGCIAAGIYATNTAEACHYITQHSKAAVLAVEDNKQLAKYVGAKCPDLKAIIVWLEDVDKTLAAKVSCPVYTWAEFIALGSAVADSKLDEREAIVKPGHCSTLIYTSGTTGPPKAVMISHDNVTWTVKRMVSHYVDMNHTDRLVSFLPLSHIAAQLIDIHVPMALGCCTYFAQPDAMKGTLKNSLIEVKPTVFFGVPRVWEKMADALQAIGRTTTGLKKTISTWAKGLAAEKNNNAQFGGSKHIPLGFGCANTIGKPSIVLVACTQKYILSMNAFF